MSIIYKFKFKNKDVKARICHQEEAKALALTDSSKTGNLRHIKWYSKRRISCQTWPISSRRETSWLLSPSLSVIKSTLTDMI
jgi:hypothetical protein